MLNVTRQCLANWRRYGIGPAYESLPGTGRGRIRYRPSIIAAFLVVRRHQTARVPAKGGSRSRNALERYSSGRVPHTTPPEQLDLPLAA